MAVVRVVSPRDIARVLRNTDKVLRTSVKRAVIEAAAVGAEIVANDAPVDTGRLKQSVVMRRRGKSGHPEVIAQAPYAGVVEVGSRPHVPPLLPLVAWVRRHAGDFGLSNGGRARDARGRFVTTGQAVAIARRIQRAIARRGTRPRYYMKNNLGRMEQVLKTLMRESKARALSQLSTPSGSGSA